MHREGDRSGHEPGLASSPGVRYAIRVQGHLDAHWSEWLDGMSLAHEPGGATRLEGAVRDQAALYGPIARVAEELGVSRQRLGERQRKALRQLRLALDTSVAAHP